MSYGITAPADLLSKVRSLVEERGVNQAAETLGIGRESTARIAAGLGVRRGTLAIVRDKLAKKPAKKAKPGKARG